MEERVLRFPTAEKMFHNINAICWYILFITGALAYFKLVPPQTAALLMKIHILVGIIFTLNFFGFVFISMDRFLVMLNHLLYVDKDTFAWFKNFGGYPRKLFKIPFGPEEVAPQRRYNPGQQMVYLFFILMIFLLIVTGWFLYFAPQALGKTLMKIMYYIHVWGGIIATIAATFGHLPLALISTEDLKAMFRIGPGDVPLDDAYHHSPKWVEWDLAKIEDAKIDPSKLHHH